MPDGSAGSRGIPGNEQSVRYRLPEALSGSTPSRASI